MRSAFLRRITIAIACSVLLAGPASAQSVDAFDPLGPPVGQTMLCYPISISASDSAAVLLRFLDGRDESQLRETMMAYDSSGIPLYFTVLAHEMTSSGKTRTHAVAGRLSPNAFGVRSVVGDTSGGGQIAISESRDSLPKLVPGSTLLTAAELSRAGALAARLWTFPCRHNRPRDPQ